MQLIDRKVVCTVLIVSAIDPRDVKVTAVPLLKNTPLESQPISYSSGQYHDSPAPEDNDSDEKDDMPAENQSVLNLVYAASEEAFPNLYPKSTQVLDHSALAAARREFERTAFGYAHEFAGRYGKKKGLETVGIMLNGELQTYSV